MPRLPTFADLGFKSPKASYTAPTYPTSSPVAEANAAMGKAVANLGGAATDIFVKNYNDEKAKSDSLQIAEAQSGFNQDQLNLDRQYTPGADGADTDYQTWGDRHGAAIDGSLNARAASISDPDKRALFVAHNRDNATAANLRVTARSQKVIDDQQNVAFAQSLNTFVEGESAPNATPDNREVFRAQRHAAIDAAVKAGRILPGDAETIKADGDAKAAALVLKSLPPDERAKALQPADGGTPAPVMTPAPTSTGSKGAAVYQGLISRGLNPAQAAALTGNIKQESNFDPTRPNPGEGGIGLIQWRLGRRDQLNHFAAATGRSPTDLNTQLDFLMHEMKGPEAESAKDFLNATDVASANQALKPFIRYGDDSEGARLAYAQQIGRSRASILGQSDPVAPGPFAEYVKRLTPEQRLTMRQKAETEASAANAQDRAVVKSLVADDESSIMASGTPLPDLTPDRVAKAYGPQAQAEFIQNRQLAQRYYDATGDWDKMPADQIPARVEMLKPQPGSDGYAAAEKYYETAQKHAQQLLDARFNDPAGAVEKDPAVVVARQAVKLGDSSSFMGVIKARLAAQDAIGIPDAAKSPITEAEAKHFAAMMRPVSTSQADVQEQSKVLEGIAKQVQDSYGPYAQSAMTHILYHVTMKRDAADVLAAAVDRMRRQASGPVVTPDDSRRIQDERDTQRAGQTGGVVPQDDPVPQTQPQSQPGKPAGAPAGKPGKLKPFYQATDLLRSDPGKLMTPFIQKFGVDAVPGDLVPQMPPEMAAQRKNGAGMPGQP